MGNSTTTIATTFDTHMEKIQKQLSNIASTTDNIDSILERLDTIEKVLLIINRDTLMESKYGKLKEIYESYESKLNALRTIDLFIRESS